MCWGFDPAIVGTVADWIVTPAIVLIGAYLAFHFQVRGKTIEQRFDLYRLAARHGEAMIQAAVLYMGRKSVFTVATLFVSARPRQYSKEMIDAQRNRLANRELELQSAILEARGNLAEMVLLFKGETQRAWLETIKEFDSVLKLDDLEKCADAIIRGMDKKVDFLRLAARNIPMRFSPTGTTDEERIAMQETQRRYRELMRAFRSKSIDEIEAYLKQQDDFPGSQPGNVGSSPSDGGPAGENLSGKE